MMLLRSLALTNIRSYNDGEEVSFNLPEGVVLFEGDIGSGKSTLLYALEFALFGLSDMKGAHLLSEGRKEGKVSLTFESGGTEYIVERGLKAKGDEVVQGECYISTGGEEERLSPSDLKERIISILGFNEPTHPRAESLVYRYAVFTPQEQMKEILTQNAEERLHVIRRVLGAQSYQTAAENSEMVAKKIREIGYGLKKMSEDLEEKRDEAEEKSRAIAELESEIPRLREAEAESSKLVRALESEWKEALREREGLTRSEAKIPLLKQDLANLRAQIKNDEEELHDHEVRLAREIEPKIREFESMGPVGSVHDIEDESDKAKEALGRLKESRRHLEEDLGKARDLVAKGVCPLCGQPIPRDMSLRNEHNKRELTRLEEEIIASEGLVLSLGERLEKAREFEEAKREHTRALAEQARADRAITSLRKKLQESNMRSSQLMAELAESESQAKAMREVSARVADLEARLKKARQDDRSASQDLTQVTTELRDAKRELGLLSEEVKKKESALREAQRLNSYQSWLSDFFRPTVEMIERQTLAHAAARFNEHFQRFFNALVDDPDMVVRVREDFSPIFEREGFEQDFEALSGGERTSMALSYRFALNAVVKESVPTRPELVILDEPTDGFSREQVYKMRGLLEELGSRQVILVSHERELESMADHIFRVEKQNGTSVISGINPRD
jgi:exonuclease SbcC